MSGKYLLALLLFTPCGVGCLSRTEASPANPAAGVPFEEEAGPTSVVPEREPLTTLEISLGLDHEVSKSRMMEIVERIRKEGKYCGQACGIGRTEKGPVEGAFWDCFIFKSDDGAQSEGLTLGYLQNGIGLYSLDGKGFEYQRREDVFYRQARLEAE